MPIDKDALDTYLNDHIAASVAALQLMDRIASAEAGMPLGALMARLYDEVKEEQELVRSLLRSEDGSEGKVKQAMAWVGEKVARVKIAAGNEAGSGLMQLEALEALSVGFWGRHNLWRSLAQVSRSAPVNSNIDYESLARRATKHLEELEPFRLAAAVGALTVA